jgi:hypothetical protein
VEQRLQRDQEGRVQQQSRQTAVWQGHGPIREEDLRVMDDLRSVPEQRRRGWLRRWMGLLPTANWKRMHDLNTYMDHDPHDLFDDLFKRKPKKDTSND